MTTTITLIGARGGQGTTSIASALAVFSADYRPDHGGVRRPGLHRRLLGVPPALDGEPTEITSTLRLDPSGPDPFPDREPGGRPRRTLIIDTGRLAQPSWGPLTSLGGRRYAVLRGPATSPWPASWPHLRPGSTG
jgi:hypothetical protein